MPSYLLIPLAVIIPLVTIHFLEAVTGDVLSAVALAMTLFVTLASWFAGLAKSPARRRASRR